MTKKKAPDLMKLRLDVGRQRDRMDEAGNKLSHRQADLAHAQAKYLEATGWAKLAINTTGVFWTTYLWKRPTGSLHYSTRAAYEEQRKRDKRKKTKRDSVAAPAKHS